MLHILLDLEGVGGGPGSLPCVSDRSGHMVGDRAHFHLLQLHHRSAVLNGSHDYHIAGNDTLFWDRECKGNKVSSQ